MGNAHDVLTTTDLGLDQWPDPLMTFTVTTGKSSGRLHADPDCPTLRFATSVTTVQRTCADAAPDLHRCSSFNFVEFEVNDLGHQRYRLTEWLAAVTDLAALIDSRPVRECDLASAFTDLAAISPLGDPDAQVVYDRAWQLLYDLAAVAVAANDPVEGRLLVAAAQLHEPFRANVPRPFGMREHHVRHQSPAVRRGWDVMAAHLTGGVAAARDACLRDWQTGPLETPSVEQMAGVRVTPEPGGSVGLEDLHQEWRKLFVAEATILLDHWLALLEDTVAQYADLPPFHVSGVAGYEHQGVWPAVPGSPGTVEVPAVAAVGRGVLDPVRHLPASPEWPQHLLDLAADLFDDGDITPAQALATAATVAA